MGSAKTDRMNRLARILESADAWMSAPVLAKIIGASERTVRSYITELARGGAAIESSKNGYRMTRRTTAAAAAPTVANTPTSADARRNYVIARLVNARGPVSLFDLADELFVSESTLASNVLPAVRALAGQFGLTVRTHDFSTHLDGSEQDKRRLLGHLATHGTYGYFTSSKRLEELFPTFDIAGILSSLVEICQRSELLINDYALNNLLTHILVIIVRIQSDNSLEEHEGHGDTATLLEGLDQRTQIMRCANEVARYFEQTFGCSLPPADFQQIVLLIALSVERCAYRELDFEQLGNIVDKHFIDTVLNILDETSLRYNLPADFDEAMRLQFVLHMHNAHQRARYRVSYPNPLAAQIKQEYAPVYDMAVYIAHRFAGEMDIELGENEIAFIAFHIGAYFERAAAPDTVATGVIIVEEYHDFARRLVDDLARALEDELSIIGVVSCDAYLGSHPECDVVITTIDVPVLDAVKILIGPILTKQNLRKIRNRLGEVLEAKRMRHAREFLCRVMRPELFARNVYLGEGADAYIDYLGGLCIEQGFADEAFVEDVHTRERVSSTAFTDCLAIPHSIKGYATRSFISVLHNDTAVLWGRQRVQFVLLIGIAEDEMEYFRDALDLIIELFSSVDTTARLIQTDTFDEFLAEFTQTVR